MGTLPVVPGLRGRGQVGNPDFRASLGYIVNPRVSLGNSDLVKHQECFLTSPNDEICDDCWVQSAGPFSGPRTATGRRCLAPSVLKAVPRLPQGAEFTTRPAAILPHRRPPQGEQLSAL